MSDEKLDRILSDTGSIKVELQEIRSAIWPDKNEPNLFTKHGERLDDLETWQSRLKGAGTVLGILWTGLAALLGIHVSKH